MSLEVACPNCGKNYSVGDHLAGKKVRCKNCDAHMIVPEPASALPGPLDSLLAMTPSEPTSGLLEQGPAPGSVGQPSWGYNLPQQPSRQATHGPLDAVVEYCRAHIWGVVDLALLLGFLLIGLIMALVSPVAAMLCGLLLGLLAVVGFVITLGAFVISVFAGIAQSADFGDMLWILISPSMAGYKMGEKGVKIKIPATLIRCSLLPLIAFIGFLGGGYVGAGRPALPAPRHAPPPMRRFNRAFSGVDLSRAELPHQTSSPTRIRFIQAYATPSVTKRLG